MTVFSRNGAAIAKRLVLGHAVLRRRHRPGRRRFVDTALALDDDPLLLCGCAEGRRCTDLDVSPAP
jgi:hypothetical protein